LEARGPKRPVTLVAIGPLCRLFRHPLGSTRSEIAGVPPTEAGSSPIVTGRCPLTAIRLLTPWALGLENGAMALLPRINTFWRVPLAVLLTIVLGTISVVFSIFDGSGRMQHACARLWSRAILFITRVTVEVEGMEKIDLSRPYIFAANHLSMFDIWAFLAHLPFQFRFVAKESLFRWPFLGWHLKRTGNIPVARTNPRATLRLYDRAGERIRSGLSVVIFPEGMRTWGESVAPFKRGPFLLAQRARVPIVPVTIIGSHRLLPRGSAVVTPGTMRMIIHTPLDYDCYKDLDLEEVATRLRTTILESYQQVG
jgi:1-acyl-sn-glycerol-3-phosphate acyltransferase